MDFNYNGNTIQTSGGVFPTKKDTPMDVRTRVKTHADIASIPNPYITMRFIVEADETNNGEMTEYIVKSLKADSYGVANSVIDEVQKYKEFLGVNGQSIDTNNFATKEELGLKADKTELHSHINKTVLDGITSTNVDNWNNKVDKVEGKTLTTNDYTNEEKQTVASLKATVGDTSSGLVKDVKDLKTNGVSQDNINSAIENYLREHPVASGATVEQAAQIQANKTAIGDNNSGLIKEVNNIKNTELQNLNTAIQTLETLVGVDETVGDKSGLPAGDANVIASINRIDRKTTTGNGLTSEQVQQLQTAYEHSQSVHVQASDIPSKTSKLINDSGFITSSSLSDYVLTSEINGLVEDALAGATVTSKSKVNYSSTAYNSDYNSVEIESGSAINITFSLSEFKNRCNFILSCSTNDISFSGNDYTHQGFGFTNASELSKTVTFTAASNITSKRYCYVYAAPYNESTNSAYDCFKIRFIISPSSASSVTYGDIVVNNTTSSINEGQKFTYTINLSQAPTNNQIVNITTTNSDVTVNPTSLTFTSSNYSIAQTVTVDVAQDSDTSSDDCQITMSSTGVASQSFNIQINDIDISEPEVTSYTITKNLTNATLSNSATSVNENSSYSATLTANSGYELSTVTITMGGADITSSSYSNGTITISNVTGNIVITANATQQASDPDPDETVAVDNLVVHFDGRDVEAGSKQAYWTNRVSGKSISTYAINSQFENPNKGWNDISKTYGWLGDSFRYYLTPQKQPESTISEIIDNYSVSVCLLQQDYTKYFEDEYRAAYRIGNTTTNGGNQHDILLAKDGTINLKFGTNTSFNCVTGDAFKHVLSGENAIIHHTTTVDFTNNKVITYINGVKQSELVVTGEVTNPRNVLQLATGGYTSPVRLYYLRIYNTVLTPEQVSNLYNQENSIVRSV